MNIMKIGIDATCKEDYLEIWDLMSANAPCVAFIEIKHYDEAFKKDGFTTTYFVGVADEKEYHTVSCGPYMYNLGLKAMYSGDEPILDTEYGV